MSIKSKIACATQGNYRLDRCALNMKRSWDEVSHILETACKHKKGRHGHNPPPPKPAPRKSCDLCNFLCCQAANAVCSQGNHCPHGDNKPGNCPSCFCCHQGNDKPDGCPDNFCCPMTPPPPDLKNCPSPDPDRKPNPRQECGSHSPVPSQEKPAPPPSPGNRRREPSRNSPFYPFF